MIFVDFETTGLLRPDTKDPLLQPGIVQVGIVKFTKPDQVIKQQWLINPEMEVWDEGAIRVHGITKDKVAGAPTLIASFPMLCEIFLGETIWSGYNCEFDKNVLFYQLQRYNLHKRFPWPPVTIDVMDMGKELMQLEGKNGIKPPKLVDLYRFLFKKDYEGAHDGLKDAVATFECYKEMTKDDPS